MQSVSSGIWTRVAVSISYDDNYYTTGTSMYLFISICFIYQRFLEYPDYILCRGIRPFLDSEALVRLYWRVKSIPSMPLLPGSLWPDW